jgi:DNA-binding protein YbaB
VTSGHFQSAGDYDGGLGQAVEQMRLLAQMSADGEPPIGRGEAAGGLVRATAANGRISAVEINPKAMRLPSQELAEAMTEAANTALADMESKYPALPIPPIDPAALQAQLAEAHDQGIREMRSYTQSIAESLARFGR